MPLELVPIAPENLPELGRICFEAFGSLHARHNVPPDMPTVEVGRMIINLCAARRDYWGVAAALDGTLVGSNFLQLSDEVAGVGPITVDPKVQTRGIGKVLMQAVIDESRRRGRKQVRLFQEALNTTSLSLYTRLGFEWKDSAALMDPKAAAADDPTVRPMTPEDVPGAMAISQGAFGHSRAEDARVLLGLPLPGFVRTRDGKMVAYWIPSLFGHGAGLTAADFLAVAAHGMRYAPPGMGVVIVPMSESDLFASALAAGWRMRKVLSYMSLGAYTVPPRNGGAVWIPSIQC